MTRTAAALVLGCRTLDPELQLKGIILNRVASDRHERILRQSIEEVSGIPVIGSVRKLTLENFPQRHLGLLPLHEHPQALDFINEASIMAEDSIDLDRVMEIASAAGQFPSELHPKAVDFGPNRRTKRSPNRYFEEIRHSSFTTRKISKRSVAEWGLWWRSVLWIRRNFRRWTVFT